MELIHRGVLYLMCSIFGLGVVFPIGEAIARSTETTQGYMVPASFGITLLVDKPNIDPGESIRIVLYIEGNSPISDHKLIVHVPPRLVEGDIEIKSFKFATSPEWEVARPVCPPQIDKKSNRFVVHFNQSYFTRSGDRDSRLIWSESQITCDGVSYPPLSFSFNTSKKISPGQHFIVAKFLYSHQGATGIAEASTPIKISSFGERNQNAIIGCLTVLIFAAPLVIKAFPEKHRPVVWGLMAALFFWLILTLWK